jgi:hypothetical protein
LNRSGNNCFHYRLQLFKWCPHILTLCHFWNKNKITSNMYRQLLK